MQWMMVGHLRPIDTHIHARKQGEHTSPTTLYGQRRWPLEGAADVLLTRGGQIEAARAYAQQLVTTRLLDCLHDPVARLSRLQRIHPCAR